MSSQEKKTRVLITRPKHQLENFLTLCTEAQLEPIVMPCIDILPVECELTANDIIAAEIIFFTSRNAVEFAHKLLPLPWPNAKVYSIGRATERVLNRLGQTLAHQPIEPYTSEAFLRWYVKQPKAKSALIIKGVGGRDLIELRLRDNGTEVHTKSVYKRVIPVVSEAERKRVFRETPAQVACITSDTALRNLINIAGCEYANALKSIPLVVNSERCAELAAKLGFDYTAKVAHPPGDDGQLNAVMQWLNKNE